MMSRSRRDKAGCRSLVLLFSFVTAVSCSMADQKAKSQEDDNDIAAIRELVLQQYEHLPKPSDAIAEKFPHLARVDIADIAELPSCKGWVVRVRVPTRREPPYYGDSHHNEYWGVSRRSAPLYLGHGLHFTLTQEVDLAALNDFIMATCGDSVEEQVVADVYVIIALGGRFPFKASSASEPRDWHWLTSGDERSQVLATLSLDEAEVDLLPIPPRESETAQGSTLDGCVVARIGWNHVDLACWTFEFGATGSLLDVQEILRLQSRPGVPGDRDLGDSAVGSVAAAPRAR